MRDKQKIDRCLRSWHLYNKSYAVLDFFVRLLSGFVLLALGSALLFFFLGPYSAVRFLFWGLILPSLFFLFRNYSWRNLFSRYTSFKSAREIDHQIRMNGRLVSAVEFIEQGRNGLLESSLVSEVATNLVLPLSPVQQRIRRRLYSVGLLFFVWSVAFFVFDFKLSASLRDLFFNDKQLRVERTEAKKNPETKPKIIKIRFSVRYPTSNLRMPIVPDASNLFNLPVGSRVFYHGTSDQLLQQAFLEGSASSIFVKTKVRSFYGDFVVRENAQYSFRIVTVSKQSNVDPLLYTFLVTGKKHSRIILLRPSDDLVVNKRLLLPLEYRIEGEDQPGTVTLFYGINHGRYIERGMVALPKETMAGLSTLYTWDMNALPLSPGQTIRFRLGLLSGSGLRSYSKWVKVSLPTLDYLFRKSERNAKKIIEQLRTMVDTRVRFSKELKKLERSVRAGRRRIDPRRIKQMRKIYKQQQKELRTLQRVLRKQQDLLSGRQTLSPQTVRKIRELRAYLTKHQRQQTRVSNQAVSKLMRFLPKNSVKNMRAVEKRLLQDLRRMLAVMKKMELLRKLEAQRARVKSLIEDGRRLGWQNRLQKSSKELSKILRRVDKKWQQYKKSHTALRQNLQSIKYKDVRNKLQKAIAHLQRQIEQMRQQYLQQSGAQRSQMKQRFMQAANQLKQQLERMIQSYQRQDAQQMMAQIRGLANDFMVVYDLMRAAIVRYQRMRYLAGLYSSRVEGRQFLTLLGSMRKIVRTKALQYRNIIQKSLRGGRQPLLRMQGLYNSLSLVLYRLQNAKALRSYHYRTLLQGDNRVVAALLFEQRKIASALRQSQQNKKAGQGQMRISLKALAQAQSRIDRALRRLLRKAQKGGLSEAEKRFLQELAMRQQLIERALRQSSRGLGRSRQFMGSLKKILKDMQKVSRDLMQKKLNKQIMRREYKLLQRLRRAARALAGKGLKGRRVSERPDERDYATKKRAAQRLRQERMRQMYRFFRGSRRFSAEEQRIMRRYYKYLLKKNEVKQ